MQKPFPIDPLKEWTRRAQLSNYLTQTPMARAGAMQFYAQPTAEACIAWINDWCVTFDPRHADPNSRLMPLRLFARQEDLVHFILECYFDKANGLIEKSRDMGASWICCCISVWLWLFHAGSIAGWGSRKTEYVDMPGDMKAVFPKIRKILEYLPRWMLPGGFRMDLHATYMKIQNLTNNSAIVGEGGDNIGRGGRSTIYFKDESAHYERAELIEAALGDNTDVQIDISSVNGSANVFYRRRMAGEVWTPGCKIPRGVTRVFILDWRDHPGKTQSWYDMRRNTAEREGLLHIFAQEVDRDYSSSIDRIIIKSEWINACIDAHVKLEKLGDWFDGEHVAGQDLADEGGDKNAHAIRHHVVLMEADHYGGEAGDAPNVVLPKCVEHRVTELYYDSIGVGSAFKTSIRRLQENDALPRHLRIMPWNGGAKVLTPEDNTIPNDDTSPTHEAFFENLKAQGWWSLRTRAYKTYRAVTQGEIYPVSELMSISSTIRRLHELKMELSQAVHIYSKKGKTMVDKKPKGARSPNLADATVQCYHPTREVSIFDVL